MSALARESERNHEIDTLSQLKLENMNKQTNVRRVAKIEPIKLASNHEFAYAFCAQLKCLSLENANKSLDKRRSNRLRTSN